MLWTVTATTLREMPRRRAALGFAFLLPLVFYASRINVQWQAIRFMAIGVGWAMATLSLFSSVSSRRLDRRLSALGASPTALLAGRQMATTAIGLVVAAVYSGPLLATQDLTRPFFAVLLLATTVLISVPLGGLVSMVISRELEGALALLSIMALQLLVDPSDAWAKALPLWSTQELTSVAIGVEGAGDATGEILHFTATMGICLLLAWTANAVRLRPVPIPPPSPDPPALGSVE
jgi:hypothetical protein